VVEYSEMFNVCLKKYPRFQLVHMVTRRVAELSAGAKPLVEALERTGMEIALQEIAEGRIFSVPVEYSPKSTTGETGNESDNG